MNGTSTVLVTGATGAQGGAVARSLLANGQNVRVLVRDPKSQNAIELQQLGATLCTSSFEDAASLDAAMQGADAAFSVQAAPMPNDEDSERRQGKAIVTAAKRASVRHLVHTSVSNAGSFRDMEGFREGRWSTNYWESKADVEDIVSQAGFPVFTILRPAFMMDNFAAPKVQYMFPDLINAELVTAFKPDTKLALVASEDVGAAASAAIANPERFAGAIIEMAAERLTFPEIAAQIGAAKGVKVSAQTLDADALVARGQYPGWVNSQEWSST